MEQKVKKQRNNMIEFDRCNRWSRIRGISVADVSFEEQWDRL